MHTPIIATVSKHITLDEKEKAFFTSLLEPKSLKRRDFLLQEGEICRSSNFVVQGCLRGFTVDKNGLEHVLSFAPENWWIGDLYSLISQQPAILNIEALEDTQVLALSKANQEVLYREVPKFERFFRIIIEKSLVANQQRLLNNMSLSAEERYQHFCKLYPTLVDRLPQKQIAAYLGITPEFFSRMRSSMLRKK